MPTQGGRVQSGALSFPQLTAPFAAPTRTSLLHYSYLDDVAAQFAALRYQSQPTGGAEVMVAGLPPVEGLTTVEEVAELVFGCVRDRFPGGQERGRTGVSTTVDGRRGWLIRSHLGYGGVDAGVRNETIIVLVLALSEEKTGLFYADIPDTHPELVPVAESTMKQLEVS